MRFRIVSTLVFVCFVFATYACPVCEKQQPKILRGITHGAGPQSNWDWVIVGTVSLITVISLVLSLRYLLRPGEKNLEHIKAHVLTL